MSFYTRYEECCRRKNISPVSQAAADSLQCTKANISTLARTGAMPRGDIIARAAQMLDVSADYLLGLTDVPSSLNDSLKVLPEEKEAVLLFHDLNPDGKKAAMAMIKGLSSQKDYTLLSDS